MFLYIFEDGQLGVSEDPPTSSDRVSMTDGLLQVLQSTGRISEVLPDGNMQEIQKVQTNRSTPHKYHYLETE